MDKKGRTAFGTRLVAARKHAKLTQAKAAETVGMSQGTLAELEMEGQGSSFTAQLAEIYGVSANWLATNKGKMTEADVGSIEPVIARPQAAANDGVAAVDEIIEIINAYKFADKKERLSLMSVAKAILRRSRRRRSGTDKD